MRTWQVIAVLLSLLPMEARAAKVEAVAVEGIISPATRDIVAAAIRQAGEEHADALIVRLSTPGGLLDATREIVEEIFRSPVPVMMWAGPAGARAASAGFFLLEAGDVAAMAPGTNTGASHPVIEGGGQMDAVTKQKMENDAAALMRTIATHRGRNVAAAEKTVRESASYTDQEALDQHLIDLIAPDEPALLRALDGRGITRFDGSHITLHLANAPIENYQPSLRLRILEGVSDPNIALLLLVLGGMGIYAEFTLPGMVAPGVIGAMLILLGLTGLSVFPIDWLGAGLMILALAFFVLEARFTTHGVLTAGGAAAMLAGALMLIDTGAPELKVRLATALAITIPFALITSFLLTIAVRARRNKITTGAEGMMGAAAIAVEELNPEGLVQVKGEYWKARASRRVAASEPVRITGMDGLTLRVEPAPLSPGDSPVPKEA